MHPRLHKLAELPGLRASAPWLGVLLLNVLFVGPAVGTKLSEAPHLLLRPSGDLFILLTLYIAAKRWTHGRWLGRATIAAGLLLWLFLWDTLLVSLIFRQTPPLYDQVYLLRHLGVLALDLWSWKIALGLIGGSAALGLVFVLARMLFRKTTQALARRPSSHTLPIAIGLGVIIAVGSALSTTTPEEQRLRRLRRQPLLTPAVLWTTPALIENLRASVRMYQALRAGIEDSPYADYNVDYTLARKPDVHLFLIESYGRILIADPEAGPEWLEHIRDIETRLSDDGWHTVSGFSQAPVSGGRSWLAEATVLTGMWVQYEAMFQQLVANMSETPNLVAYLDAQGYETVLLAPKDRPRPGVENVNRYAYDQQVLALDLEYTGPGYGWGIIPDQYSLGFSHDNVFSKVEAPLFTNFHMVSSHAPWNVVPEIVPDWRAIADAELPTESTEHEAISPERELWERARHYRRAWTRNAYMGDADALTMGAFAQTIHYDLELLTRHLQGLPGDKLVVIMGDHQPPLLSSEDNSYDVPVHVLSRDPALLAEFKAAGFVDGFVLEAQEQTAAGHEGLFSLIVRSLVGCCATDGVQPPPYLPDGVRPDAGRKAARSRAESTP